MNHSRNDEIRKAAWVFIEEHPMVWRLFIEFTNERIADGFKHGSANAVFERIRWETDQADVDGQSTFKLNNNYRAVFARWFMTDFPEHDGFFRLRKQTSADDVPVMMPELTPVDFPYVNG